MMANNMDDPAGFLSISGIEGISSLLDGFTASKRAQAQQRAINRATAMGRTQAQKLIMNEARFSSSKVNGLLKVTKKATDRSPSAKITASMRPASLVNFALGVSSMLNRLKTHGRIKQNKRTKKGINVQVKPNGKITLIPGAFLFKARNDNIMMAIRLKKGETLPNNRKLTTWKGLTFLYGPSVDQIFRTVRVDISDDILRNAEKELIRQLKLNID